MSTGWGALSVEPSEYIHPVEEVPHEWLFPRVDAVIHHGGSGTTAAGLRAGRPTLVCPILGDQPFWGRRVAELGAGPGPLPLRRATPGALSERIVDLLSNAHHAERAGEIAARIASEDGPGEAVRTLEEIEFSGGARRG